MFGSSIIAKGKAVALRNYGNEAERAIGPYLFDDDVQAVVPGQAVVVYDEPDAQVLMSGWIHHVAEQAVA